MGEGNHRLMVDPHRYLLQKQGQVNKKNILAPSIYELHSCPHEELFTSGSHEELSTSCSHEELFQSLIHILTYFKNIPFTLVEAPDPYGLDRATHPLAPTYRRGETHFHGLRFHLLCEWLISHPPWARASKGLLPARARVISTLTSLNLSWFVRISNLVETPDTVTSGGGTTPTSHPGLMTAVLPASFLTVYFIPR